MTACGARCFSCYCVIMHLDFVVAVRESARFVQAGACCVPFDILV